MRATRARARLTWAAALLLLVLLVPPPVAAQTETREGYERSKLTYLYPVAFVVSFVIIGFVLVRAVFMRSDDATRLRAATAKVDQALGTRPAGASTGTAPYHSRSGSADRRQARSSLEARLLAPRALRLTTD